MNKINNTRTALLIEKIKQELRPVLMAEGTLLLCGGLGGHMSHIHESDELTFGDMKAIMHIASKGKLEHVSEKLDGQNTFFTFSPVSGLRFARNTAHIKTNGMDGDDIEAKWGPTIPTVAKAFGDAYKVLSMAVSALPPEERARIFGAEGNIWYSAEILATANPNVINYDKDAVVLHDSGVVYDENGKPTEQDTGANFELLIASLNKMQSAIKQNSWKILGPVMVPLERMSNNFALEKGLSELNAFMNENGMSNDNTTVDLLEEYVIGTQLADINTDDETKQYLGELIADFGNKKDPAILDDLVGEGLITTQEKQKIKPMFSMSFGAKLHTVLTEPLKIIIQDFAVEVLRQAKSLLVLNPDKEVQRLKDEVQIAINALEQSDVLKDKEFLAKQMRALGSVDKITSSMEGLVFKYKGNVYKLTGGFAVMGQILGFFKYGR